MNFKEAAARDVKNVFFNLEELAELQNVNGNNVKVVIDEALFKEKHKELEAQGIIQNCLVLFIQVSDLPAKPKTDRDLFVDNKKYKILDSKEKNGVYEIDLQKYEE